MVFYLDDIIKRVYSTRKFPLKKKQESIFEEKRENHLAYQSRLLSLVVRQLFSIINFTLLKQILVCNIFWELGKASCHRNAKRRPNDCSRVSNWTSKNWERNKEKRSFLTKGSHDHSCRDASNRTRDEVVAISPINNQTLGSCKSASNSAKKNHVSSNSLESSLKMFVSDIWFSTLSCKPVKELIQVLSECEDWQTRTTRRKVRIRRLLKNWEEGIENLNQTGEDTSNECTAYDGFHEFLEMGGGIKKKLSNTVLSNLWAAAFISLFSFRVVFAPCFFVHVMDWDFRFLRHFGANDQQQNTQSRTKRKPWKNSILWLNLEETLFVAIEKMFWFYPQELTNKK